MGAFLHDYTTIEDLKKILCKCMDPKGDKLMFIQGNYDPERITLYMGSTELETGDNEDGEPRNLTDYGIEASGG